MSAFKSAQQALTNNPATEPDPEVQTYIDLLEKGEPLPLPLGKLTRRVNEPVKSKDGGKDGG